MKKIVFFNTNIAWGGGEKWHLHMAKALKLKNYDITIVAAKNSELAKRSKEQEIHTLEIKASNSSFLNPMLKIKLKSTLKQLGSEVIFFNSSRDIKICAKIAKEIGIKKVIYRRGMPHPIKDTWLNKKLYSYIDIIIANSQEIADSVYKNIHQLKQKTQIIYNGVMPQDNPFKKMNEKIILGNLSRLVDQKGHDELLEVAVKLKKQEIPFLLKIAGEGPKRNQIQAFITQNSLEDCVELCGHVNPKEFLAQIDLFVFTSHFEGSSNALIESLQFQVPVIAFDISSNSEVVEHNKEGILVPAFETSSMTESIISLRSNQNLYNIFRENAKLKVEAKFNYEEKVNQVISIIGT